MEVIDSLTGKPLKDFDLKISSKYDPPYDNFSVDSQIHVDSSPFIFKGLLFHPGTMTVTASKGDTNVGSTSWFGFALIIGCITVGLLI